MMEKVMYTSAFMIVDPFDITYNPGKTIRLSKEDNEVEY